MAVVFGTPHPGRTPGALAALCVLAVLVVAALTMLSVLPLPLVLLALALVAAMVRAVWRAAGRLTAILHDEIGAAVEHGDSGDSGGTLESPLR